MQNTAAMAAQGMGGDRMEAHGVTEKTPEDRQTSLEREITNQPSSFTIALAATNDGRSTLPTLTMPGAEREPHHCACGIDSLPSLARLKCDSGGSAAFDDRVDVGLLDFSAVADLGHRITNPRIDHTSRRREIKVMALRCGAGCVLGGLLALFMCLSAPIFLPDSANSNHATGGRGRGGRQRGDVDGSTRSQYLWRSSFQNASAVSSELLQGLHGSRWLRHKVRIRESSWLAKKNTTSQGSNTPSISRRLLEISRSDSKGPQLVIAGKMSVKDGPCNIAQYNLRTNQWSMTERIQLSLYNSYSGGEVFSLLANHTYKRPSDDADGDDSHKKPTYEGSGELIVVGAFDTTYRNSQVTFCSVGKWDGNVLSKVGEGLCNNALSRGMKITTAALAGPQDVYVAGSFQTQVWNGDRHEFVKIFNIAHFNAIDQVWMPLNIGQITCSWCTVTVLALAWDSTRNQLHVAGKFDAIDGRNVPAGLAIYDRESGHLVAHPGGGLSMWNRTEDGVGTALQLDEDSGILYVMGSFERLTATNEVCLGLAAYEINANRWTCLADAAHTVAPTGGGNMLLTPFGLMVAGQTDESTTWPDSSRPYTIALLKATLKTRKQQMDSTKEVHRDDDIKDSTQVREEEDTIIEDLQYHAFNWSWLPGFDGHSEKLHALSNGFGEFEGTVFIAGDNLVAKWSMQPQKPGSEGDIKKPSMSHRTLTSSGTSSQIQYVPVTEILSGDDVYGSIMSISQMMPEPQSGGKLPNTSSVNVTIIVYCVAVGCVIGMFGAILFNRNLSSTVFPFMRRDQHLKGISLDTLTYSAIENSNIMEAYQRAMQTRYVHHPHLLTIINPQEIFLQRIIGEGTFGRVWSAKWRSSSVAVKEFVFAQAAVAGRSSMQQEIVEEIIGEAGMMAILRHPNVLQLFGCSLTAQAIWIVSELCSLGSLRQLLDDNERSLPVLVRARLALQVAEGMTYLHNQDPPIIHRDLKSHNIFVHETFTDTEESDAGSAKKAKAKSNEKAKIKRGDGSEEKEEQEESAIVNSFAKWLQPSKMTTQSTIVAKIGDWGSARATLSGSRTMTHGVGTACWLAPEVIKHARSSKYSDVYGYGIVLWELATREEVYQGYEATQIIAKVANESLRPPVPQDCPWKELMVKCWQENPHDRLDFDQIVVELNKIVKHIEDAEESLDPSHHGNSDLTLGDYTNRTSQSTRDDLSCTPELTEGDALLDT